jgi:hypothetical protein
MMNKYRVCWMWGTMPNIPQIRHKDGGKSPLIIEAENMRDAASKLKDDQDLPYNGMLGGDPSAILVNEVATNWCMVYRYNDLEPFNIFEALTTGEL